MGVGMFRAHKRRQAAIAAKEAEKEIMEEVFEVEEIFEEETENVEEEEVVEEEVVITAEDVGDVSEILGEVEEED